MRNLKSFLRFSMRNFATKIKSKVNANEQVLENIKNEVMTPKTHPGIYKPRNITLPDKYIKAIENVLADYPVKALVAESTSLQRYLQARHPPMEHDNLRQKYIEKEQEILSHQCNLETINAEERNELRKKFQMQIQHALRREVYAWQPINYDAYTSLQYLLARAAQDYAVAMRIFKEISVRDPEFKPRSFFDFGSGIGTGMWAVKEFWQKHIFEYYNVDISRDMNDLALILLQDGRGNKDANVKGVFYRQFLPGGDRTYDIVLSAFSLMELPTPKSRLEAIIRLWNKTEKYLVIIEHGSKAGFGLVNEARDLILELQNKDIVQGHIFSPCPHDFSCPRFATDKNMCRFEVSHTTLPFHGPLGTKKTKFSYVVMKKGTDKDSQRNWPRLVDPIKVRSKHSICQICCENGKLKEIIFTASKHGKDTYYCARSSKWGDQLPINVEEIPDS